jgi:hypothetical protein
MGSGESTAQGHSGFFALRLHETEILRSTAQKILNRSPDWRFLRELKGSRRRFPWERDEASG